MPKPLKKQPAPKKSATPKRPASDPNRRARQLMAEHLEKVEASSPPWKAAQEPEATPPHGDPFEAQFRARMAELGRKGGKVSGAKRMEMPAKKRRDIAMKAAKARWEGAKGGRK